ncbi:hypothetical protein Q3O98_25150 [Ralstonia pseudosolanacearum]|uniref:hypothetical protein n=1 Tax=Ralstonia pseudosolanacearum TaxID=1310165 RepID=UPI0026744B77|nr:hypothetical protein [Ralstonia pseudosolanacearum]MDO3624365.1 hypothetical protein [Ralstonia pseudosolanacearum]
MRALGLTHYWQQLLDERRFVSVVEITAAEGIDASRVWLLWGRRFPLPAVAEPDHGQRLAFAGESYAVSGV